MSVGPSVCLWKFFKIINKGAFINHVIRFSDSVSPPPSVIKIIMVLTPPTPPKKKIRKDYVMITPKYGSTLTQASV